jgi:hypothetical protein
MNGVKVSSKVELSFDGGFVCGLLFDLSVFSTPTQ